MNRRSFLAGLLSTTAVAVVATAIGLRHEAHRAVAICDTCGMRWPHAVLADIGEWKACPACTDPSWGRQYPWFVFGAGETMEVKWSQVSDQAEWTTGPLTRFRISNPEVMRGWYGSRGL